MALLAFIAAIILLAAWVLTHLPRAEIAPVSPGAAGGPGAGPGAGPGGGPGGGVGAAAGLSIANSGLPLRKARVTAKLADGTTTVIDAGRLPRGTFTLALPAGVHASDVRAVVIEGEVLGMPVNAYSIIAPKFAGVDPARE